MIDDLGSTKLDFPVDLNSILSSAELATIGFTAGSAAEAENHDISKWSFSPNFTSQQYAGTAVDADTDGTSSFVMTEYHPGADPATNYNLNPQVDTSVLPDRATEIWAKYYFPNNLVGGPFPLVVLLHGNHATCGIGTDPRVDNNALYTTNGVCPAGYTVSPSHKGYDYLANKLTSWGYIVVSINSNLGINSGLNYLHNPNMFPEYPADPKLIWARGRLVLRHLQKMSEWNQGVTQFTTSATLGTMRNDITGWVGEKVTIGSVPVTIRSLGRMYRAGNIQTHTVKIVKATDNTTVASVSVPMSNGIHGQFKYTDLSVPVSLVPNTTYYIVSQETNGGDEWGDSDTTLSTTSVASLNGRVSSLNGTAWDSSGGTPDNGYGPVDFIYDAGDTTFVTNMTLGTLRNNLGGWIGMKITTNSQPIKVRSLGRIFTTGNNQNHTVKIVKVSDNSTVASVPISMTGGIDGQFKYATLASSVILEANTSYYVVSQEAKNKDQWYDSDTILSTTTAATVNGRVSSNNGNTWDISGGIVNRSYGPVDIVYETNNTPLGVDLKNKIDFGNVGLMGHSRGGEGVRAAYNLYNEINGPWSKTSGRIRDARGCKLFCVNGH